MSNHLFQIPLCALEYNTIIDKLKIEFWMELWLKNLINITLVYMSYAVIHYTIRCDQ